MDAARIAAVLRGPDDVVLSDAFDEAAIVEAARIAHRHAFAAGNLAELERLLHAHRTATRIVVATRQPEPVRAACEAAAAILVSLEPGP